MVADATTTQPSPPSIATALDSDALLTSLLTNQLDSLKTAIETGTPLGHLIAWTARPEIQKAIDTFRQLQFASVNTRILASTATARIDAVTRLHELSKTTTDPVELRRAATLILRYSTPLRWVTSRTEVTRHSGAAPLPAWVASRSAAALPSNDTEPPTPTAPAPKLAPIPAEHTSSSPPRKTPPPPRAHSPAPLPHFTTPAQLLQHFERSLIKQRPTTPTSRNEAIHSLHRYLAPSALINTTPVPSDAESLARNLDAASIDHLIAQVVQVRCQTKQSDDLTHTATLDITRHRQPLIRAEVELKRITNSAPWRIASLTTSLHSG